MQPGRGAVVCYIAATAVAHLRVGVEHEAWQEVIDVLLLPPAGVGGGGCAAAVNMLLPPLASACLRARGPGKV